MKNALLVTAALTMLTMPAASQSSADSAAIRATALDYIEGWYAGDAERMAGALHPELAKRIVRADQSGASRLGHMTKRELVNITERGGGTRTPEEVRRTEVRILDIFEGIAAVRVDADSWIDHLQIAKWDGRWVIVNVLWEMRPS